MYHYPQPMQPYHQAHNQHHHDAPGNRRAQPYEGLRCGKLNPPPRKYFSVYSQKEAYYGVGMGNAGIHHHQHQPYDYHQQQQQQYQYSRHRRPQNMQTQRYEEQRYQARYGYAQQEYAQDYAPEFNTPYQPNHRQHNYNNHNQYEEHPPHNPLPLSSFYARYRLMNQIGKGNNPVYKVYDTLTGEYLAAKLIYHSSDSPNDCHDARYPPYSTLSPFIYREYTLARLVGGSCTVPYLAHFSSTASYEHHSIHKHNNGYQTSNKVYEFGGANQQTPYHNAYHHQHQPPKNTSSEPGTDILLMPLYPLGDLLSYIRRCASIPSSPPLPEHLIWTALLNISTSLSVAHSKGIVHADVKPQNVFLTKHGVVLGDWGLSVKKEICGYCRRKRGMGNPNTLNGPNKYNQHQHQRYQRRYPFPSYEEEYEFDYDYSYPNASESGHRYPCKCSDDGFYGPAGTEDYEAPELLLSQPFTPAIDLWGLGCILYELTSLRPFMTVPRSQLQSQPDLLTYLSEYVDRQLPSLEGRGYSRLLIDVITCLLNVDPKKRLDVVIPGCEWVNADGIEGFKRIAEWALNGNA